MVRTGIIWSTTPRSTSTGHRLAREERGLEQHHTTGIGRWAKLSYVIQTFDGEHSAGRERIPGDTDPEGKKVLAGKFTFQDGIPLEPRS